MLKKLLQILKNKLAYSRINHENLQRDLEYEIRNDTSLTKIQIRELSNVLHCGAYYTLYDIKQYKTKEIVPYAIKYSELVDKYVPNIDLEYPNNIKYIYEQFKKDILSID